MTTAGISLKKSHLKGWVLGILFVLAELVHKNSYALLITYYLEDGSCVLLVGSLGFFWDIQLFIQIFRNC